MNRGYLIESIMEELTVEDITAGEHMRGEYITIDLDEYLEKLTNEEINYISGNIAEIFDCEVELVAEMPYRIIFELI